MLGWRLYFTMEDYAWLMHVRNIQKDLLKEISSLAYIISTMIMLGSGGFYIKFGSERDYLAKADHNLTQATSTWLS